VADGVEVSTGSGTNGRGTRKRLGLREVRALGPGGLVHDPSLPGFGARRRTGEAVTYFVLYYTADGRRRRFTIGRHGAPWTPDTAREKALEILAEAKVKGADPAAEKRARREDVTVSDLCDAYLADVEAGRLLTRRGVAKKASTIVTDRSRIDRHIRPLLGAMKVSAVTRADVERFMHAVAEGKSARRAPTGKKRGLSHVRGGKGAASRTVGLLGALFTYAAQRGMRSNNPVTGTVRYADGRRERRLSDAEYNALGRGLSAAAVVKPGREGKPGRAEVWPAAIAAAHFLALTGWRSGEALALRWRDVDLARRIARLPDTKTGASIRPLSHAACDVLRVMGRGERDALVFPASRGAGGMTGFPGFFARIAKLGGLPGDVTPHVLRHSFVSLANDLGYTEATVGMLVGHKGHGTTRGYIHGADEVLLEAADRIAGATAEAMGEATATGSVMRLGPKATAN